MNSPVFSPLQNRGFWLRGVAMVLVLSHASAMLGQTVGTVSAWGANDSLQSQVPTGLARVVAVAGGESHSLALKTDGTVVGWGFNLAGQATVPAGLTNIIAIAAGSTYSVALKSNGTVQLWGSPSGSPAGLTNVVAIAAGTSHVLALKADGSVISWGSQTIVPGALGHLTAIAAGNGQSLGLRSDGTVVAWGDDSFGKAEVPPDLDNVIAIAAGRDHCLALRQDGTIVAWGRNDAGQATVPPEATGVFAIGAGAQHSIALRADGSLIAWGDDTYGQVSATPHGNGYVGLSAGGYHNLAIKGDGHPVIFTQPASQTAFLGQNATLNVLALGTQPLNYQWQHGGTNLASGTGSILVISGIEPSDAGIYTVRVSNPLGSVASQPALLTVAGLPPQIVAPFQDLTAICGDSAALRPQVDGAAPFAYQWQFQGIAVEGATNADLLLTNVNIGQAGNYSVVITNMFGSVSTGAVLSVVAEAPQITSALSVPAVQGAPFSYTIQATHSPSAFGAQYLPYGLAVDPATGIISGVPLDSGTFGALISATNSCTSGNALLVLTVSSSAPVMNTVSNATGAEGATFQYQITASGSNLTYAAQNLPPGLTVNPGTGVIAGKPIIAGTYDTLVSASNPSGTAWATVRFFIVNNQVSGLSIGNVNYKYSAPYLLDFSFSLEDNDDPTLGNAIVTDPRLLSVTCFEDDEAIGSETDALITRTSTKVIKAYLVLDFTASIASLATGDTNHDGVSDAVDNLVNGAITFVNQQSADTQIGVYEFHREDMAPSNVVALTTDKVRVDNAIAGIWTNNVEGFTAGSRCWDAMQAAILGLGAVNRDEEHYLILVSDGRDESSTAKVASIISAATNANIRVFAVGFGAELDAPVLQNLATQTQGRYYTAQNAGDIANQLAQVTKDARGQYVLRWSTLKRAATAFMPSFQIRYQGLVANSPTNPFTLGDTNVDTTTDPPTTNITPSVTNFIIGYFSTTSNAGPVLAGSLRLVPNAEILPTGVDLRATYIPRYVRQLRLHYRANWPCVPTLQSTGPGELLSGWSMTQTNDGAGGSWLLLSSPDPLEITTSLPFASFGRLVTFSFEDAINSSNAFSVLAVDNTIYTNTGGQSFAFENTNAFVNFFPVLPLGTPAPWLAYYKISGNLTNAELLDSDNDGVPNWQEFRANTNPTNAASVFMIRNVSRQADGRYQILFGSGVNRTYRVDASTDLVTWRTVQDNIPGLGQDISITDTEYVPISSNIFYRAVVY